MKKVKSVDEYISLYPRDVQSKLKEVRKAIKSSAPKSIEKISYGMPYYGYDGRLVYFAAAKNHIGVYFMPRTMAKHEREVAKYRTGKATLQFPLDKKIPIALIRKLVKTAVKVNEAN